MTELVWLIPLFPLLGFVTILLFGRRLGEPLSGYLATGAVFASFAATVAIYLDMLGKVVRNTSGVRRPGAAALDLCYVAAGRLDAFWEIGLQPWDLAAGSLIIREAGGIVSGLDGSEDYLDAGHVLCGTPKIYAGLARMCAHEIKANFVFPQRRHPRPDQEEAEEHTAFASR